MYYCDMEKVPLEVSEFFKLKDFSEYPKVFIPQRFIDERGEIVNIADGSIGDVAIIYSKASSSRANHVHESDWHFSYCLSGSLNYSYEQDGFGTKSIKIGTGELFFTPAGIPHRMDFLQDSVLVVVSRNSRKKENYDQDTRKYILDIESIQ